MRRHARILVVDDQPANLTLVRRILDPVGFAVSEARSGAETVAVAQEKAPDLILLDMHLPDMHGLDVVRRLRENPKSAGIRIVAMSALATPEDRELWLQAGCMGTIEKPINVRTFPEEVSRWLPGAKPSGDDAGPEMPKESDTSDRLGELLVANLLISPEQLAKAINSQPRSGKRLGQILVEQGALSEDDIAWALSHQLGYPYVFLTPEIVDAEAVRLLPESLMRERRVLPILKFGHEMTLAMVDPTDQQAVEEVVARTGLQVKRALALASNIEEMQNRFFPGRNAAAAYDTRATVATEAQYFQFHLVQALQQGSTEIHFDPAGDGQARVRYRLQGVLVDRPAQPVELHDAILRHLRDLTRVPEGAIRTSSTTIAVGDKKIMLVAAFLPTIAGQAATVTIQALQSDAPDLTGLGVSEDAIRTVRDVLQGASGLVLVGCDDRWVRATLLHGLIPVGSRGKIWALETVPAYRRSTINQTLLDPHASPAPPVAAAIDAGADLILLDDASRRDGLLSAFEAGRSRVVLAGHVESSVAALLAESFEAAGSALVASTVRAVVAARAIRLLCPACKQPTNGDGGPFHGQRTFVPAGCEACGFTGFKGRRLLIDVWVAGPESRRLLLTGQAATLLARLLDTPSSLRDAGHALVLDGLTSADELTRVAG